MLYNLLIYFIYSLSPQSAIVPFISEWLIFGEKLTKVKTSHHPNYKNFTVSFIFLQIENIITTYFEKNGFESDLTQQKQLESWTNFHLNIY